MSTLIAAIRSLVDLRRRLAVRPAASARRSCCSRSPPDGRAALPRRRSAACASGLWLSGITVRDPPPREHPARSRRGLRGQPRQQRRAADPLRGAERSLPAPADPLQGGAAQAADPRARVRPRRLRPARARQPRPEPAGDRARRRGAARGQLVPDLSRGHAQPDRRALALQEGRLHHGDEGAGADRAGRHQGGARRHEEGEPDHPPGAGDRQLRRADRDRRAHAGRSRRA